jgi:hypothetical protein
LIPGTFLVSAILRKGDCLLGSISLNVNKDRGTS